MTVNYGHFDPQTSEYVITDPMTPEPWINYLDGNGKMNAFISNGAGGTVWYDQPHTGRLTRYRLNGLPIGSDSWELPASGNSFPSESNCMIFLYNANACFQASQMLILMLYLMQDRN